jgi:phosphoglycerate dehydrogenase-like enzyme
VRSRRCLVQGIEIPDILPRLADDAGIINNAFGMKVIAWSQNLTTGRAAQVGATLVSRNELFQEADVVSIHLVLSKRTLGLVGAAELALMKPTARLVNTSRGPFVVEADLVAALRDKSIAGAAIDVFEQEPLGNAGYRLRLPRPLRSLLPGYEYLPLARRSSSRLMLLHP